MIANNKLHCLGIRLLTLVFEQGFGFESAWIRINLSCQIWIKVQKLHLNF
jgi:hypothetical protein